MNPGISTRFRESRVNPFDRKLARAGASMRKAGVGAGWWAGAGALVLGLGAFAGPASPDRPAWQRHRAALDHCLVAGEFRLFYTRDGGDALPPEAWRDCGPDGVPWRIRDLAAQLVAARRCCVEALGLRHFLDSPRYRGRVRYVDVNVWALPEGNGQAGDGIVNYQRDGDPPGGIEVLTIDLSCQLKPGNLTPAHEVFHLFQNGYTFFKTPWYYEGMARWAEDLLGACRDGERKLPRNREEVESRFRLRYEASGFWRAMAEALEPAGNYPVPPDLAGARYPGCGARVLEDEVFRGALWLRAVLEELDACDEEVAREGGWDPGDWPEARQRGEGNSGWIWRGMVGACRRHPGSSPGLLRMLEEAGAF